MALARYRNITLNAVDPVTVGRFWATVLNLSWQPDTDGAGAVVGPAQHPVLWVQRVPEPKKVKHRVHLDIYAASLADLEALGASVVLPEGDDRRWTIMADPDGGEFCAFLRDVPPSPRLHGLVVDCAEPAALARFWVDVLGGRVVDQPQGYSTAVDVPGMTFTFDFVPVPEPKTVPNRVHWDLAAPDLAPLVAAGATVLREPDDEIDWYILADPEGNDFCVAVQPDDAA